MARRDDSVLTFPFPVPPAPGEVLELLPGLYSVRLPLPLQLDHVNVWVFDDGDGLTVVDTGIADERTPALLRQARARLPKKPITRLLVTHHHPDHSGMADRLCEENDAELLMSAQAYEAGWVLQRREGGTDARSTAAGLAKHGLSPEAQQFLIDHEDDLAALKPGMPPMFTELRDDDTVKLGSHTCRVIFGQGHAPDHVCLYAPGPRPGGAGGFLISGDMLLPSISTHVGSPATWAPGNPVTQFQQSVRKLAALPADTFVLPSHGAPFYGARERVAELERHHEQRCLTMLLALDEPHSAAELLAVVFRRQQDPLQLMFAMNEATAHLEYMSDRGDVERLEGEDGVIRYVRKDVRRRVR
jgi:glyoxylase-like metal-dependent hydrolase (beta-lactamase superfamily II)